jgi:hypothetical protein
MGSNVDHSENPSLFADVLCRVAGYSSPAGYTEVSFQINSNNVIGDHCWLWLADHGYSSDWDSGKYGLIVSGNDVTMYGTFVEHYPHYQTIWYGERGRVYFYQNESPYRPTNQAAWMSKDGTQNGWSAYKIWNTVDEHYAIGLGLYTVLNVSNLLLHNAAEAPHKPGIKLESLFVINIGSGTGSNTINIINDARGPTSGHRRIGVFENGVATTGTAVFETIPPADEPILLPTGPQ